MGRDKVGILEKAVGLVVYPLMLANRAYQKRRKVFYDRKGIGGHWADNDVFPIIERYVPHANSERMKD
jgi:hypothetical protein